MKSLSAPRMYGQWLLPCMLVTAAVGMACGDDTVASNAGKGHGGEAGQSSLGGSDGLSGHDTGGRSPASAGGAGAARAGADVGGNPAAGADPGGASAGAAGSTQVGSGGAAGATSEDAGGASGSDGAGSDGGDGGDGGFTAGLCQEIDPISPALPASCADSVGDSDCVACVKVQVCDEYQTCFGQQPATACSTGTQPQQAGQFVCTTECFAANSNGAVDADELLVDCAAQCSQCPAMLLNEETIALIEAANDSQTCQSECFPFE
ncbi:MAG TPA: hypothetical protein VEX18_22950 [Polyangiaceae bacterium]|nr:hypothetical protein [Polyangiaceae bacterium]